MYKLSAYTGKKLFSSEREVNKKGLFDALDVLLNRKPAQSVTIVITRTFVKDNKGNIQDYLRTMNLEIRDNPDGYSLIKRGLPEFKIITSPGTLLEKFLAKGKIKIQWKGFIPLPYQRSINAWKQRRSQYHNPKVVFLGYDYDVPCY